MVLPPSSSALGETSSVAPAPQSSSDAVAPPASAVIVPGSTQPTASGPQQSSAPSPVPGSALGSSGLNQSPASLSPTNGAGASPSQISVGGGSPTAGSGLGSSLNPNTVIGGSPSQGGVSTTGPNLFSTAEFHIVQSSSHLTGNSLPTTPAQNPAPGTTLPATTAPVITAGGTTIVGNSNTNFVIGSSTLTPGGTVIVPGSGTQSPTTFVLASSGTAVIVNGATQSVQQTTIPAAAPATSPATIFTAGGSTFTFNSASNVVIGSLTLTPGGTVIIPGSGTVGPTTYVLPTSGSAIIVNGATQSIRVTSVAAPKATTTPLLVVGGTTYTANSASAFVIGSQTLTRGGVITASGVTLSFATAGGTVVQISGGTTSTESLGGIINSVGGFSTATPTYVTASKANHERPISWALSLGLFAGVLGVLVL